ncbi:MAG: nucleotide exchange factor GrpE [Candidatus Cloacimonadales bacterium]|jgi:molecular chaperone GrpE|nr:nucleotide exchange factor GrpE [Candidatus Cloacimonadota bacterium]MDD2650445.1 nucleotide exchange factor GrpE [Candidatus Cloacimonadota bacterium]MDD3501681.1 nucleotide exchange factor GrpE [Candidatus Cloacimonadota bacterium]MDX9977353.1 nucleotide exchange factor GrpE [Candidatus Cloacimonadales bacterium]
MKRKTNIKDKNDMLKEEKERIIPIEDEHSSDIESQEMTAQETEETDSLEEELDKLMDERDEFKDKWLRTLAEFDNFRRNTLKEKSDWVKYSNEKLVLEICDVFDNFERALTTEVKEANFEAFKEGIALIYQQIEGLLKRNNVTKIEYENKEFDPNFHEALAYIPSEYDENTIAALIQNGYKMNDRVIRAARVAVSNGTKPEKKEN